MSSNYFKCPSCKKITEHVEISFREFATTQTERGQEDWWGVKNDTTKKVLSNFSGVFGDISQVHKICGSTPYKCTKCLCLTMRKSTGEAEEIVWP